MKRDVVVVKAPASTSNLGSGFDTLGLAVKWYTRVHVSRAEGKGVEIASALAVKERAGAILMVREAAELFFRRTRRERFGIVAHVSGNVPVARGLGFSSTVRVGVLAALNELAGTRMSREELLQLATQLEGHPDNASPAIFGGFTVSGVVEGKVRCLRFPVSSKLKLVTLIPNFRVSTERARALLPGQYVKADAAHALNRAALISAAFASGDYENLRGLFDDRMHQPYREKLIPQLARVIRAGEKAGAIGGFLSGSGSAIICLTRVNEAAVAGAMAGALAHSEAVILAADHRGFVVESR